MISSGIFKGWGEMWIQYHILAIFHCEICKIFSHVIVPSVGDGKIQKRDEFRIRFWTFQSVQGRQLSTNVEMRNPLQNQQTYIHFASVSWVSLRAKIYAARLKLCPCDSDEAKVILSVRKPHLVTHTSLFASPISAKLNPSIWWRTHQ